MAAWRAACPDVARPLLALLLLVDAAFVLMHVLHRLKVEPFVDLSFNLNIEGSYPEIFQHLKELGIAAVLAMLARRQRSATLSVWAGVFFYILLDDSMSIHERGAAVLVSTLPILPAWGLSPIDLGEAMMFAIIGAAALLALATVMLRGRASLRRMSRDLLLLLGLLAVFGVGIDMLHAIASARGIAGFSIVEDGGEMAVMSLIAACVLWHARSHALRGPPT